MNLKNSWHSAIKHRTSRRTYQNKKIESHKVEQINSLVNEINEETGLNIQLVENGESFLSGFKASYGLIGGTPSLIALVGNTGDPELLRKIGYYGEFIVLECESLGLGTCWIRGTYDRKACLKSIHMRDRDDLICVLAVGSVAQNKNAKELLVSIVNGGKQSFDELLTEKDSNPPSWVADGIEAARLAPSAANGKPIGYRYRDNQLTAFIVKKNHGAEEIDLGISMAHFELGALHGRKEGIWVKVENGYSF
jgi:hypothetical protein